MKTLDLLHRWAGGLIGLVLLVLGLSGTILIHRDAWVMLPHADDAQMQATPTIIAATEQMMADPAARPSAISFATDSFGLNRLSFGREAGAYADQAGNIVTHWDDAWERPELFLFDLHHHLLAGETGEIVAASAGLCGLFFVISGVILWWRTRRTFEFRLIPRRLSRPAILRHHRDLGIVFAPLLALVMFTGMTMVFRPVTALVLGPSAPATIEASFKAPEAQVGALAEKPDWAAMIGTARRLYPDAEIRILSLPKEAGKPITLRMKQSEEWLPNGRTTLWFAPDTGRLIEARDALKLPGAAQAFNTFYPLHAAKVGGLAYRLVMTLVGLALSLLGSLAVWSFWFRRNRTARRVATGQTVPAE
ncbi:MAG: peptidase [Sphingomonadales bacterium RIFCSPHIGHO2_01_FULL_65_20]|jgi:uncharacterized iron-regulated membrane protein|uniref:PepSY-associated TM helix domain-containing protein n=1 Tax=unclassified Blastomonas TaxID=2626550 RepID=UPI00082D317C|nr:PepSY domain-containing protein [Blastomonas sp.]MCH2237152.1 PepSY domain-containing protein [Blastomonas sp.]OHC92580.1 MAG: peptidase [Sphingomonadales bacterium RIFCSPHIGHO2_01_FULL_65_20]